MASARAERKPLDATDTSRGIARADASDTRGVAVRLSFLLVVAGCAADASPRLDHCIVNQRLIQDGAVFFDGCNSCTCAGGAVVSCTARLCDTGRPDVICDTGDGTVSRGTSFVRPDGSACRCSEVGDVICDPVEDGACVSGERLIANGAGFYDGCNPCECRDGAVRCQTARGCAPGGPPDPFCFAEDLAVFPGQTWISAGGERCRCSLIGDELCI